MIFDRTMIVTSVPRCLAAFYLFFFSSVALGYEVETHEEMSERATMKSTLASPTGLLNDLELQAADQQRFLGRTVVEWFRLGARHEDDAFPILGPDGLRFKNHFYNPLNGQGFTHPILPNGLPSPAWGLEDTGSVRGQDHSIADARNYYYRGLTAPNKRDRDLHLASTFRSLGQVIHLIQDAAQPQHTRNDSHGSGSLYEEITNDIRNDLPYDGYPVVRFENARSYWHTQVPGGDVRTGQGMAEYSNRGFVSAATNFRYQGDAVVTDPNFVLPAFDPATALSVDVTTLVPGTNLQGQVIFYGNDVSDSYQNTATFNQFATTLSIFDADLKRYVVSPGSRGFFTLNRFNFYHAHPLLIPKAVGYSAGLIDHFFRGRIGMARGATGQHEIRNLAAEEMSGVFALYYDDVEGTRHPVAGAVWDTNIYATGGVLAAGSLMHVPDFVVPSNPAPRSPGEYLLVFRGRIGTEEPQGNSVGAVAAKVVRLPTFLGRTLIIDILTLRDSVTDPIPWFPDSFPFTTERAIWRNGVEKVFAGHVTQDKAPPSFEPCESGFTPLATMSNFLNFAHGSGIRCFDTTGHGLFYEENVFVPASNVVTVSGVGGFCRDSIGTRLVTDFSSPVNHGHIRQFLKLPEFPLNTMIPISELPAEFRINNALLSNTAATHFIVIDSPNTTEACSFPVGGHYTYQRTFDVHVFAGF